VRLQNQYLIQSSISFILEKSSKMANLDMHMTSEQNIAIGGGSLFNSYVQKDRRRVPI
jgi:hypothetical protein